MGNFEEAYNETHKEFDAEVAKHTEELKGHEVSKAKDPEQLYLDLGFDSAETKAMLGKYILTPKETIPHKKEKGGLKYDHGKLRYDLLPFRSLDLIVEILGHGARKYGEYNWEGVSSERYIAACLRHVSKYVQGEVIDGDSGLHHLAHAACSLLFIIHKETKEN